MTTQNGPANVITLLLRAREQLCALPLDNVIETMRPLPIEPMAGSPPFVCGLSVVRGVVVPVADLGAILGLDNPPKPGRFVTLKIGERQVALSVEEVIGISRLPLASLDDLPPLLCESAAEVVSAVGRLDTSLLFALEAGRIVPESIWQAIENNELK